MTFQFSNFEPYKRIDCNIYLNMGFQLSAQYTKNGQWAINGSLPQMFRNLKECVRNLAVSCVG